MSEGVLNDYKRILYRISLGIASRAPRGAGMTCGAEITDNIVSGTNGMASGVELTGD